MNAWTGGELSRIAATDEVQVAARRDDGSTGRPTTIWVVRDGDDLYVRSWHGTGGGWYRAVRAGHAGSVTADGVTNDVTFSDVTDTAVNDRVDAAYRAKYSRYPDYVEPMVADRSRATTLKLEPR